MVLILRCGAQNSASDNLLAPMAVFAAPNLTTEHPRLCICYARSDIASSGGIDLEPVFHLHFRQEKDRSRVGLPALITRITTMCSVHPIPFTRKDMAVWVGSLKTCVGALNHAERNDGL